MMMIKYFKGEPGAHIIRYRNGKIVAHGDGAGVCAPQ